MTDGITFRNIERELGIANDQSEPRESLEIWYESVRDKPIALFSIEDICKACRQGLYATYVVPEAINRLSKEPFSGEKYDGELLVAVSSVPTEYWVQNVAQTQRLREILKALPPVDSDLAADVRTLHELTR